MTLDKHQIDGLSEFSSKTLPAAEFEVRLSNAGTLKPDLHQHKGGE
jgi:hypothetical protein